MRKNKWTQELDSETKKALNNLLLKTFRHKSKYIDSKEPLMTQLWLAVTEIHKEQMNIVSRIENLEQFFGVSKKKYSLVPTVEEY